MAREAKRPRCTAKSKRSGKRCQASPIHGGTVCVAHGGRAGQVKRKAAERVQAAKAQQALAVLGRPLVIDPHAALLEEVHRTAGHVAALAMLVEQLQRDGLVEGETRTTTHPELGEIVTSTVGYNVWLRLYQDERKHLLLACRTAIACGVERKRVELEERQGALIADVFRAVFDDPELGLAAEQRRAALVATARHLRVIAGGKDA